MHLPKLAEWRRRRALAIRDLAAKSGVGPSTINRIELGHQAARPSTTRKLATALGVDPMDLMGTDKGRGEENDGPGLVHAAKVPPQHR
jgi:transcriptional regulator with XRE-family HTH domain